MTPKEKAKDARLRREYHITLDERNKLFDFQGKSCYICRRKETKKGEPLILSVDHSHQEPAIIRGLLCWQCNKAIAILQDKAQWAARAADYLYSPPFTRLFGERLTAPGKVGTKKRAKLLKKIKQTLGEK
jgi:hypothetical protein